MTRTEMFAIIARFHSWRPQSENEYLADRMEKENIPFCATCGDWHHANEQHSMTDENMR
jgi:hypothetical protein